MYKVWSHTPTATLKLTSGVQFSVTSVWGFQTGDIWLLALLTFLCGGSLLPSRHLPSQQWTAVHPLCLGIDGFCLSIPPFTPVLRLLDSSLELLTVSSCLPETALWGTVLVCTGSSTSGPVLPVFLVPSSTGFPCFWFRHPQVLVSGWSPRTCAPGLPRDSSYTVFPVSSLQGPILARFLNL